MIIDIAPLRKRPRHLQEEIPVPDLDLGPDPFVRPGATVSCDLRGECVGEELLFRGTLTMDLECLCARCGAWFRHCLTVPGFTRSLHLDANVTAIDLTQDIREDMILAFPSNWVCREDCRGVCPGCGTNLNTGACGCGQRRHDTVQEAWGALEKITPAPDVAQIKDKMEDNSDGSSKM